MPLSPEDRKKADQAVAMRMQGVAPIEIGEKLGLDLGRLRRYLYARGEDKKDYPPIARSAFTVELRSKAHQRGQKVRYEKKYTPEYRAKIISQLSLPGASYNSVGKAHGISMRTVRHWHQEAGRIERRAKKAGVMIAKAPAGGGGGTGLGLGLLDRITAIEKSLARINTFLFGESSS